MNSKLLGGLGALIAASVQVPALAQNPIGTPTVPSSFDYNYTIPGGAQRKVPAVPPETPIEEPIYEVLPDLALPDRTLPERFVFPINYILRQDSSITSDFPITLAWVGTLTPIPNGVTLDDVPRLRAEYTRAVEQWGELVTECLGRNPSIINTRTGNPILLQEKPAGTIVLNANNISVCPR